jgi:hypothetical protein
MIIGDVAIKSQKPAKRTAADTLLPVMVLCSGLVGVLTMVVMALPTKGYCCHVEVA